MSNPYKMFETDRNLETDGITIDYGDFKFKVARAGGSNTKYNKMIDRETKPFRRQINAGSIDNDVLDKILKKVFAKTVVLSWENVKDKDGNLIEFSYENCLKLFEDLPDLFTDLREQAANMELFKTEIIEGEAKN